MHLFNFRLQRVLDLRERHEQESAARLTAARQTARTASVAHESAEQARTEGREQSARVASATGGCAVGQLHLLGAVLEHLDDRADETEREMRDAEASVDRSSGEFAVAARDRRALDRLKDRHRLAWQQTQTQHDRTVMDAVALTRFVRRTGEEENG